MATTGTNPTTTTPTKPPRLTGDVENDALAAIRHHLGQLNPEQRRRVLTYTVDRLGFALAEKSTT